MGKEEGKTAYYPIIRGGEGEGECVIHGIDTSVRAMHHHNVTYTQVNVHELVRACGAEECVFLTIYCKEDKGLDWLSISGLSISALQLLTVMYAY